MEQKQTINNVTGQEINAELATFQDSLKLLRGILDIQCINGNWNSNPYMHGLANGMILALSLFGDKPPEYLAPPEVWLCDIPKSESES